MGNFDKLYTVRAAKTKYYAWNKEQKIGDYFCRWWIPKYSACSEVFTGDKPWETGVGIAHFHMTDYSGRLHTRLRWTGMFGQHVLWWEWRDSLGKVVDYPHWRLWRMGTVMDLSYISHACVVWFKLAWQALVFVILNIHLVLPQVFLCSFRLRLLSSGMWHCSVANGNSSEECWHLSTR